MSNVTKIGFTKFHKIPDDLIRDNQISGLAKAVYAYIEGMADDYDFSVDRIASYGFKESEKTIRKAIVELEDNGWMSRG